MWTFETALLIIRQITPVAKAHGFVLAFYGSVLTRGQGNDLDLYFVSSVEMTTVAHAKSCLDDIARTCEAKNYRPLTAGCTSMWLKGGHRIDAQFLTYTPLQ
jgi:hypothetical protein